MALVITRKDGQSVRIGKDILVTLVKKSGTGHRKLRVEAPADMDIWREEQYQETMAKNGEVIREHRIQED